MKDIDMYQRGGEGLVKYYTAQLINGFEWKAIASIIGTVITVIEGFYGSILWAFLALFVLDLITGIMKSHRKGVPITSRRLRDSVVKLGSYMILITALIITGKYEQSFVAVTTTAYYYFIFTELKSIMENVGEMGVNIPAFLKADVEQRAHTETKTVVKETPNETVVTNTQYESEVTPEDNKIVSRTKEEKIIIKKEEE
jgi:phage-related holin